MVSSLQILFAVCTGTQPLHNVSAFKKIVAGGQYCYNLGSGTYQILYH
jgi:hypothetical protein